MWSKTVSFRRRGERRKKFFEKFFRAENFGVQTLFFRVFAYRRGRRTGVVLPEKGQKSPKTVTPLRGKMRPVAVVSKWALLAGQNNFWGQSPKMGAPPPPSVFEVRSVSIKIGLSAERRKNFFGARKKPLHSYFPEPLRNRGRADRAKSAKFSPNSAK